MSSELQKKLYEMEVTPPEPVWAELSLHLDEINADIRIAAKVQNIEIIPAQNIWKNIEASFESVPLMSAREKTVVITLKRLAVAAVIIGIIVAGWILINNKKNSNEIATISPGKENITTTQQIPVPEEKIINKENPSDKQLLTININKPLHATVKRTSAFLNNQKERSTGEPVALLSNANFVLKEEKPGEKIFNQPIDDLSMIAASDNYFTMVSSDGRMLKIPAHFAHLAPRLQDKPITEDYYEILFGEGAFWKEKLIEWRRKLAESPVSSGDMFSTTVELLKSIQTN